MLLPELRSNLKSGCIRIYIHTLGFQRDASGADTGCRTTSLPTKSSPSDGVAARASALQPTHLMDCFHSRMKQKERETARSDPRHRHTTTTRSSSSILIAKSRGCADAEADMPSAEASGARCVQNFDGSRNSAIHTTYRISLRSSSIREPRYPLLRVVLGLWYIYQYLTYIVSFSISGRYIIIRMNEVHPE